MTAIVSKEMVCLLISQLVEIMVKHLLLIVSVKPLRFMDT